MKLGSIESMNENKVQLNDFTNGGKLMHDLYAVIDLEI